MRTRDAVRNEILAMRLALEAGTDCCPTPPCTPERDGWFGRTFIDWPMWTQAQRRRYQVGVLARAIWEGLPRKQKWWLR